MAGRYRDDYPSVPIGGGNPYQKCAACGVSAPEINGDLSGHSRDCSWRIAEGRKLAYAGEMAGHHLKLGAAIDGACGNLPDGFEIVLSLEQGGYGLQLNCPEEAEPTTFDADCIEDEIELAVAHAVDMVQP